MIEVYATLVEVFGIVVMSAGIIGVITLLGVLSRELWEAFADWRRR